MLTVIFNFSSRRKGDPERAEPFLKEALKSYVSEGWSLPVTHTRKQVAECQKLLDRIDAYPLQWWSWIHFSCHQYWNFNWGCIFGLLKGVSLSFSLISFIIQHRYLQTSTLLAGDVNLTTAERQHFCQEILNFPGKSGDKCKWYFQQLTIKREKSFLALYCTLL